MGFTLRSFLLPEGIRAVTTRMRPLTVSPDGAPAAVAEGRPNRRRFLGFNPSGSPWWSDGGLARRPLAAPLGFALLGYPAVSLVQDFARTPLSHFSASGDYSPGRTAPQSVARLTTHPIHLMRPKVHRTDQATLLGFSHLLDPAHYGEGTSGLLVHLTPRPALLRIPDAPWKPSSPYRSCRDWLRCRAFATFTST
jgi:hypothetical protein